MPAGGACLAEYNACMPTETELFDRGLLAAVDCNPAVLERITLLAIELARAGREGRKVGTIFTIGDVEGVLRSSRPIILDPLAGHPAETKRIFYEDMRETAKELAQLDGAFVVSATGVVVSACRFLNASSAGISLPLGLGSRHMAAASMSKHTRAVCVVLSQSSMVRVFDRGDIVREIVPEQWMMRRFMDEVKRGRDPRTADTERA